MTDLQSLSRQDIQPFILVGGLSERFGSDKSLVRRSGSTQIEKLHADLMEDLQCPPILIRRSSYIADDTPFKFLVDEVESQGPLCGIATGLKFLRSSLRNWALFVTCDHFQWDKRVVKLLTKSALSKSKSLVAFNLHGHLQPFPSLWRKDLYEPVASAAGSENRSVKQFLQSESTVQISLEDSGLLRSFNTLEEFQSLLSEFDETGSVSRCTDWN